MKRPPALNDHAVTDSIFSFLSEFGPDLQPLYEHLFHVARCEERRRRARLSSAAALDFLAHLWSITMIWWWQRLMIFLLLLEWT